MTVVDVLVAFLFVGNIICLVDRCCLARDVVRLKQMVNGMAARIADQSYLLSRRAEKEPRSRT